MPQKAYEYLAEWHVDGQLHVGDLALRLATITPLEAVSLDIVRPGGCSDGEWLECD